jgi:hypothetical protein
MTDDLRQRLIEWLHDEYGELDWPGYSSGYAADALLGGPLTAWQETFKREHDSLWVSLHQMRDQRDEARAALDRVRAIADEIGRGGEHGGLGVIAHRLRRAIDPDAT